MSDLEAAYQAAAIESGLYAPGMEEFAINHARKVVDAALAALADGDNLYVRKGSDGATRTSQYVKVWPNE